MPAIEEILKEARRAGASDLHLTAGIPPRMRVNGSLVDMDYPVLTSADTLDVLVNIMTEPLLERFEEQEEYDAALSLPGCGRCRVSAFKQKGTVALAFRLAGDRAPTPEELEMPKEAVELYRKSEGLILVAGAAGSGKTASLAALVEKINENRSVHIVTLENPVEYLHPHRCAIVNQREIGIDVKGYADGIRAAIRADADVIVVSELQDAQTVNQVVAAAETGHLVLAAMLANSAGDAVERLVELFPAEKQKRMRERLETALEAVVFKRLLSDGKEGERRPVYEITGGDSFAAR